MSNPSVFISYARKDRGKAAKLAAFDVTPANSSI